MSHVATNARCLSVLLKWEHKLASSAPLPPKTPRAGVLEKKVTQNPKSDKNPKKDETTGIGPKSPGATCLQESSLGVEGGIMRVWAT